MTVQHLTVKSAHLVVSNGRSAPYQPKHEVNSAGAQSIRLTLNNNVKRRLGIPLDHLAYISLIIAPIVADDAINEIVDQLLDPTDAVYGKKR